MKNGAHPPLRERLEKLVMHPEFLASAQAYPQSLRTSRARLERFASVAAELLRGLKGEPFHWGDTDRGVRAPVAAAMGFTLVSATRIKKLGRRLKRGAKPVGSAYFGSPIRTTAELWILECQTEDADA